MAPGSDFSSIMTAVESGADSVYFGVRSLNMRANARNIPLSSLPKVMNFLHKQPVAVMLCTHRSNRRCWQN